ncbi:MAG: hypothetical protein HYR91_07105 [Flavobacteriia bacterium]|nr:hypothetical protein [Flavobacteriia bacterium]
MKKLCILFICISSYVQLFCQDTLIVKASLLDKRTSDSVSNALVRYVFGTDTLESKSNYNGVVFFKIISNTNNTLTILHPLYVTEYININEKKRINRDTIRMSFYLLPMKINEIPVVTIYPKGTPQKIFYSEYVSVADFEVLPDGKYILLTYPKKLNKGSDVVLYDGENIISNIPINDKAVELIHDFRGNPHVVCEKNVFGLYVKDKQIAIATHEKNYFMKYLAPILDSNYTKYYITDFNKDYPSMNYYAFDQMDSTYSKIITITDDFMMELYRSEYKWVDVRTKLWAKQKEQETGIDAQIWVGANYFTQSVYYKKLYAPMFHRNDTLFVFDYYKDLLFRFNKKGDVIDSLPIYHQFHAKETGWKNKLIQDQVTGQIYALFDESGYASLRRINTNTGELMEKIPLKFRYVDKIEVHDNAIYYIYRPFESIQKKYLYKELIPLNLEAAKTLKGDELNIEK